MLPINFVFFFNDTATAEIYTYRHTLSLTDALPFSHSSRIECAEDALLGWTRLAPANRCTDEQTRRRRAAVMRTREQAPEPQVGVQARREPPRQIGRAHV